MEMNYAKAIRVCRVAFGLKQVELANRADVSKSYLSLVESGDRKPSLAFLSKISSAMGVPQHLISVLAMSADDLSDRPEVEVNAMGRALLELLVAAEEERQGELGV